jgi:hypothetical protein
MGMQIGESFAELNILAIDGDAAKGTLSFLPDFSGQVVLIDTQVPPDTCFIKLKIACSLIMGQQVGNVPSDIAEYPYQHIEKVNTDIGGDASGLLCIAFP